MSCYKFHCTGGTRDEIKYKLVTRQEAHKRIVWACSWNPSGHQFATGSRDKTVKIWAVTCSLSSCVELVTTLPTFKTSVTALSWNRDGILAVGMESGLIELWNQTSLVVQLDPFMCHVSSVSRLAWKESKDGCESMELASSGADHCVRVFKVTLV